MYIIVPFGPASYVNAWLADVANKSQITNAWEYYATALGSPALAVIKQPVTKRCLLSLSTVNYGEAWAALGADLKVVKSSFQVYNNKSTELLDIPVKNWSRKSLAMFPIANEILFPSQTLRQHYTGYKNENYNPWGHLATVSNIDLVFVAEAESDFQPPPHIEGTVTYVYVMGTNEVQPSGTPQCDIIATLELDTFNINANCFPDKKFQHIINI